MNPNIVIVFVEYSWTVASFGAVCLSLWALPRAHAVKRDMRVDLATIEESGLSNGRLSFASQQLKEGAHLLRAHWKALAHQLLFFLVGMQAIFERNEPLPIGTPLMEVVGAPVMLLVAQYIIVWLQVDLVKVTFEQERWRVAGLREDAASRDVRAEQLQDTADDTNQRIREMQEHGDRDRGEEQLDREASRQERVDAGVDRDESGVDRDESVVDREEARPHRGTAKDEREAAQDEREAEQDEREARQDERDA